MKVGDVKVEIGSSSWDKSSARAFGKSSILLAMHKHTHTHTQNCSAESSGPRALFSPG